MGLYTPPDRTAKLVFDEFPGAEVVVRLSCPLGFYLDLVRRVTASPLEAFITFGDVALVEWNLADRDGNAIPATGDGMAQVPDIKLAVAILNAWMKTVKEVPGPLPESSGATPT